MKKTKAAQRVEIAKDVIKHIKAKKITTKSWTYFDASNLSKYSGKQLKEVLPKLKKCEVCALGGMFYSYVNRYNDFTVPKSTNGDVEIRDYDMRNVMKIFTTPQLYLIETAFEGKDVNWNQCRNKTNLADSTIEKAIDYRTRNGFPLAKIGSKGDKILIHIMNNIIKNKGTFKP